MKMKTPIVAEWLAIGEASVEARRSSHGLAVLQAADDLTQARVLIAGGEIAPREPCQSAFLNRNTDHGTWEAVSGDGTPAARVGAAFTSVHDRAYLWGGRFGAAMDQLVDEEVWVYDGSSGTWHSLETSGLKPSPRSYHCLVSDTSTETLWLHGGCTSSGRTGDLHSLNLKSRVWTRHADAPGPGRGGTAIVVLPGRGLLRWGGFCGREIGGPLAIFDFAQQTWCEPSVSGPEPCPRSVFSFQPTKPVPVGESGFSVAVICMGEVEGAPSTLGHAGAGEFASDVWVLLENEEGFRWIEAHTDDQGVRPTARGWFDSDLIKVNSGQGKMWDGLVLHGGLNANNERLGDTWRLRLHMR